MKAVGSASNLAMPLQVYHPVVTWFPGVPKTIIWEGDFSQTTPREF